MITVNLAWWKSFEYLQHSTHYGVGCHWTQLQQLQTFSALNLCFQHNEYVIVSGSVCERASLAAHWIKMPTISYEYLDCPTAVGQLIIHTGGWHCLCLLFLFPCNKAIVYLLWGSCYAISVFLQNQQVSLLWWSGYAISYSQEKKCHCCGALTMLFLFSCNYSKEVICFFL